MREWQKKVDSELGRLREEVRFLRECLDTAPPSHGETFGFDTAFRALQDGSAVRRASWSPNEYLRVTQQDQVFYFLSNGTELSVDDLPVYDLFAQDWQIFNLPSKPRTAGKKSQEPRKKGTPWRKPRQ